MVQHSLNKRTEMAELHLAFFIATCIALISKARACEQPKNATLNKFMAQNLPPRISQRPLQLINQHDLGNQSKRPLHNRLAYNLLCVALGVINVETMALVDASG